MTSRLRALRPRWLELRPPRRLLFTRSGAVFTAGILAVGLAAVNTGNNLLYLLLGALLGFLILSGILSERALRRLTVVRRIPRGVTVGRPARIQYEVRNGRRRTPAFTVEVQESGLPVAAFVPWVAAGESAPARSDNVFVHRGVHRLQTLTLSTSYPFGLFRKERDLQLPGELVVWPATDRAVREPRTGGGRGRRAGILATRRTGTRGEYRGLRGYRMGDEPRDIHWRSTARMGALVVREYERDDASTLWICLDREGLPGERAEGAVEVAAALAARTLARGRQVGFATQGQKVKAGSGPGQLEAILDALARLDFDPDAPHLEPPGGPERCLLVSLTGRGGGGYGEVYLPGGGGPGGTP